METVKSEAAAEASRILECSEIFKIILHAKQTGLGRQIKGPSAAGCHRMDKGLGFGTGKSTRKTFHSSVSRGTESCLLCEKSCTDQPGAHPRSKPFVGL